MVRSFRMSQASMLSDRILKNVPMMTNTMLAFDRALTLEEMSNIEFRRAEYRSCTVKKCEDIDCAFRLIKEGRREDNDEKVKAGTYCKSRVDEPRSTGFENRTQKDRDKERDQKTEWLEKYGHVEQHCNEAVAGSLCFVNKDEGCGSNDLENNNDDQKTICRKYANVDLHCDNAVESVAPENSLCFVNKDEGCGCSNELVFEGDQKKICKVHHNFLSNLFGC